MKRGNRTAQQPGIRGLYPAASAEGGWTGSKQVGCGSRWEEQRTGRGLAVASIGQQALGGPGGVVGLPVSFSLEQA